MWAICSPKIGLSFRYAFNLKIILVPINSMEIVEVVAWLAGQLSNSKRKIFWTILEMSCELNTGGGPGSSRSSSGIQMGSAWFQRRVNLRPQRRGVHLVTEEVLRQIPEISQFSIGLAHFQSMFITCFFLLYWVIWFIFSSILHVVLHTSASLALNESWDPDVRYKKLVTWWNYWLISKQLFKLQFVQICRDDMEMMLNRIIPEVSAFCGVILSSFIILNVLNVKNIKLNNSLVGNPFPCYCHSFLVF